MTTVSTVGAQHVVKHTIGNPKRIHSAPVRNREVHSENQNQKQVASRSSRGAMEWSRPAGEDPGQQGPDTASAGNHAKHRNIDLYNLM